MVSLLCSVNLNRYRSLFLFTIAALCILTYLTATSTQWQWTSPLSSANEGVVMHEDTPPPPPPPPPPRIGIVVAVDTPEALSNYKLAQATLRCYAEMEGYAFNYLYFEEMTNQADTNALLLKHRCQQKDIMFKRHCYVVEFMLSHPELEWILFLDADMGVVNPLHRIEEWLPKENFTDPPADIIFYNRAYNWEVMAGSYLAKNNEYSRRFLTYWASFSDRPHAGTDNEMLHQVFMHYFASPTSIAKCDQKLFATKDLNLYSYMACARYFLGRNRTIYSSENGITLVLPKGKAWCRDGGGFITSKWAPRDFLFHLWKDKYMNGQTDNPYHIWTSPFLEPIPTFNLTVCSALPKKDVVRVYWEQRYRSDLKTNDEEIEKVIVAKAVEMRGALADNLRNTLKEIGEPFTEGGIF